MINTALTIIDRFVHLLTLRQELSEKQFEHIVKPLYEDAELVYRDHLMTFEQLKKMIKNGIPEEELIRFLEERRLEYLPVRMKIRAVVIRLFGDSPRAALRERSKFVQGIWSLMRGGVDISEPGHFERLHASGDHTLLDILYLFLNRPEMQRPDEWYRQRGWIAVEHQLRSLKEAWEEIVAGYAEMQNAIYNK